MQLDNSTQILLYYMTTSPWEGVILVRISVVEGGRIKDNKESVKVGVWSDFLLETDYVNIEVYVNMRGIDHCGNPKNSSVEAEKNFHCT